MEVHSCFIHASHFLTCISTACWDGGGGGGGRGWGGAAADVDELMLVCTCIACMPLLWMTFQECRCAVCELCNWSAASRLVHKLGFQSGLLLSQLVPTPSLAAGGGIQVRCGKSSCSGKGLGEAAVRQGVRGLADSDESLSQAGGSTPTGRCVTVGMEVNLLYCCCCFCTCW
jgi:hypothetical protein